MNASKKDPADSNDLKASRISPPAKKAGRLANANRKNSFQRMPVGAWPASVLSKENFQVH